MDLNATQGLSRNSIDKILLAPELRYNPSLKKNRYVIHSDKRKGYNGLVGLGYKKHYRLNYGKNEFVEENLILMELKDFGDIQKQDYLNSNECIKASLYLHLKRN